MKREIKFRAWDETTNEMLYELGDLHVMYEDVLSIGYNAGKEHPTVGHGDWVDLVLLQCTGLKSQNDQAEELYEGDVVYLAGYGLYTCEFPFTGLYEALHNGDIGNKMGDIYTDPELQEG